MKKRVFVLLAFAVVASPVYAADNCSGEFTFQPTGNSPGDVSTGKITTWTSASTVSSDNTPYNGSGTCSGYTYEKTAKRSTRTCVCASRPMATVGGQ